MARKHNLDQLHNLRIAELYEMRSSRGFGSLSKAKRQFHIDHGHCDMYGTLTAEVESFLYVRETAIGLVGNRSEWPNALKLPTHLRGRFVWYEVLFTTYDDTACYIKCLRYQGDYYGEIRLVLLWDFPRIFNFTLTSIGG